jgi:dTDP-L-rhamnose 4-epimerase
MRVLVTGNRGKIGAVVADELARAGHAIVPFDLTLGYDVRDGEAVNRAMRGCDAVVHLAAARV